MKPRQWRSMQEMERDPAFLERAAQEFPSLREALAAQPSRRTVLRLMGAAFAMSGLTGCYAGNPGGVLIPAVRVPPDIIPGQPNHYATAHVHAGTALGTVVTHQMGRPIKVEGNPNHPSSLGATDVFAQAEVLSFYDPSREMAITAAGTPSDRQSLLTAIAAARADIAEHKGDGFRILSGAIGSPTAAAQLDQVRRAYPDARWHQWEPINRDNTTKGTELAYGRAVDVIPRLDAADVIVAIDSDLIEAAPGWVRYARDFAGRRNPTRTQAMSRVYAIEPAPSLLGSVADHRFVAGPRELRQVVAALAAGLLHGAAPGTAPPWVGEIIADLKAHHGRAFIHAGPEQPPELHALVHAMNEALGARGATLQLIEPVLHEPQLMGDSLAALVGDMQAGHVTTLLILDANPVFTAPGTLGFAEALKRVKLSFALTREPDETAEAATWSVPMAHGWEAWGDARGHDGTASILQPQALPLYGGITSAELLGLFMQAFPPTPLSLVQQTWRPALGGNFDQGWHDALATGVLPNSASPVANVALRPAAAQATVADAPAGVSLRFQPDPSLWDGRYANNPWLQELPRPLTKLTWDNPLLISPAMAGRLAVSNGDHVELSVWRPEFAGAGVDPAGSGA